MTDHFNPPTDLFQRVRFGGNPVAHPDSVVVSGQARFTVLTPRLLRLEWSETGEFEDRATYAFPTRYALPPDFTVREAGGLLLINTGALILNYQQGSGRFTRHNLSIEFDLDGAPRAWVPGKSDPENLRGTRRTLDQCAGDAALEEGLLSRAGWALFDDSRSVVFRLQDGWVAPRPDHQPQDWYFFCYGHDYRTALTDYTRFGGRVPLIPHYALGAWWSRYWAYSERDLRHLVEEFERRDLPLDVLVIDMDWHTPHSWTGYTWNRELFPDPPAFLRWLHERGLRATLNLHPAQGVQAFEEIYPRFAEAMGVDPAGRQPIPFRIADKKFVRHYFELLHHLMEDQGVDFWWLDWQQGEASEMKGLDPLPWLNHLHFRDAARRGRRPMLFSRWGGLGNHRYPIGFSGDTYSTWSALQFQPYFTATASNVLYGWWSHDIGGHMGGATQPELYARWVQFGALSPCLRLHATKDPRSERRPWAYPDQVYQAAKAAFHWRYQLVPYLYTMARVAYDTGLSLCRPMYYEYPEVDGAYAARYQYFLGDQMIAAPIVHPADPATGLAAADVWVPQGTWIDYQTQESFTGPRWARLVGDLERLPMLIRAGGILPLAPPARTTDQIPADRFILEVFPFPEGSGLNSFRLYQDDGLTLAYQESQLEWTEIRTRMEGRDRWTVEISPVEGRCDALPEERSYQICLVGSRYPERVMVDGAETSRWRYDPEKLTTTIDVPARDRRRSVIVAATTTDGISALGEAHNRGVVLTDVRRLLGEHYAADAGNVDAILRLRDAPGRADAVARLGGPLVRVLEFSAPEEASQTLGRVIVGAPVTSDGTFDVEMIVTRRIGGEVEEHVIELEQARDSQILDLPIAWDGAVRPERWEAEVRVNWRGQTLTHRHLSQSLFPSITTWRVLTYDEAEGAIPLEQALRPDGTLSQALAWKIYAQTAERLPSLSEPYALRLYQVYEEMHAAGNLPAGYLATTVVSPDDREVVLQFGAAGQQSFYLNRMPVAAGPEPAGEEEIHPLLRSPRRSEPMRLRAGRNTLLVETRPMPDERLWYFTGRLLTPDGEPMTDLTFE